jgi:type II secretion system protein D
MLLGGPPSIHAQIALHPAQNPATHEAATYQAYPLQHASPEQVRATVAELLRGRGDARVLADNGARQILVQGSPEIQQLVVQVLPLLDQPGAESDPNRIRVHESPGGEIQRLDDRLQTRSVKLVNSQAARVLVRLKSLFGSRLVQADTPAGEPATWVLTTASNQSVQIDVDEGGNELTVQGSSRLVAQIARLIEVLDSPKPTAGQTIRIVPLRRSNPGKVEEAVNAFGGRMAPKVQSAWVPSNAVRPAAAVESASRGRLVQALFHNPQESRARVAQVPAEQQPAAPVQPPAPPQAPEQPPSLEQEGLSEAQRQQLRELGADVEIESLGDLDVIILRGRERDVEEMIRIIEEIERISAETTPQIEVIPLRHANSAAVGRVITPILTELLTGRQGRAMTTPLSRPNAILVVGWGEALAAVRDLIFKLDQPVSPEAQFRVFRLRNAAAVQTQTTLQDFFREPGQTATPRVVVTADQRTNSLIVQASPADLAEVEVLLTRLDVPSGSAVNVLRLFRLQNTLAIDMAPALQAAISGTAPPGLGPAPGAAAAGQRIEALQFFTLDAQGQQLIKSGTLADVRITPEPRTNTIIVSAPPESIELIAALIEQLDQLPATTAQIKVFRIVNGDAARLVEMLQALLGTQALLPGGPQLAAAEGEGSLAPLRFSVDHRTNSIIASGSPGDLTIVEAILLRLDESDVQERRSTVFRLKNAPALDVSQSINEFLRSERRVQEVAPGTFSPFQQIEAEVVVVPEPVSNSLIISATPRYFDEILQLVERLDAQPPQVMIQVLIADVQLDNAEEFGVELGIQDSVLFDRSVFSNVFPSSARTYNEILSSNLTPGFLFNDPGASLGNSGGERSLATASNVGGQALTNFGVARVNPDVGFGGLVLSASSENVSILIRALREKKRLDVLSRPQVMTLDNQPAFIQVGQRVPYVQLVSLTSLGQVSNVELINVGLILGVTPRISPDGTVVMEIDAERSELGPESEGIPISVSSTGQVIRSPRINTTTAQTTVSAADGQTIVLGGLITKSNRVRTRRVPLLSDIPVLGLLFRYDLQINRRTELLIILTPHVVRTQADADQVKQAEAARMNWCLGDVEAMQGPTGIHRRGETEMDHYETIVVYPDDNPRGVAEPIPAPSPVPPGGQPERAGDMPVPSGPQLPAPNASSQTWPVPFAPAQLRTAPHPAAGSTTNQASLPPAHPGKLRPEIKLPPPAVQAANFQATASPTAGSRITPRPDAGPYLPKPEGSKR